MIIMSQNNSGYTDYMDGVPVKISDKYKPPPEITLPYGVVESSARANEVINSVNYDFSLETNVLKKLIEWQNARETLKNERNHRLQLLEEAKQRELDLKAATETEEKLKQLSISEISYPSTEEISEISPDDSGECRAVCDSTAVASSVSDSNVEHSHDSHLYSNGAVNKSDIVCDILQPTPVAPSPSHWNTSSSLLDDPNPNTYSLPQLPQHNHQYLRNMKTNNLENLTYLDFENDTSSPFDNLELKTINDKELLAQVLTSNNIMNVSGVDMSQQYDKYNISNQYSIPHSTNPIDNTLSKTLYNNSIEGDVTNVSNTLQPFTYSNHNGYYQDTSNVVGISKQNNYMNYYAPEYINYTSSNMAYQPQPNTTNLRDKPFVYNNKLGEQIYNTGTNPYQRDINNVDHSFVNPYGFYNYYYTNANINTNHVSCLPITQDDSKRHQQESETKVESSESKPLFGSRSKSVPDIVKELGEEIDIRVRAKERSHNCSPSIRPQHVPTTTSQMEILNDPYKELSPELQGVCKRINSMGFPLDRVARACQDIGGEEKKIIEYLLFMGQLMDLGFSESLVSKALLKNNNNRDRALDELIS